VQISIYFIKKTQMRNEKLTNVKNLTTVQQFSL